VHYHLKLSCNQVIEPTFIPSFPQVDSNNLSHSHMEHISREFKKQWDNVYMSMLYLNIFYICLFLVLLPCIIYIKHFIFCSKTNCRYHGYILFVEIMVNVLSNFQLTPSKSLSIPLDVSSVLLLWVMFSRLYNWRVMRQVTYSHNAPIFQHSIFCKNYLKERKCVRKKTV